MSIGTILLIGGAVLIAGIAILVGIMIAAFKHLTKRSNGDAISTTNESKSALVIIDMQLDYTQQPGRQACDGSDKSVAIENINRLIKKASDSGSSVIYVHNQFDRTTTRIFAKLLYGGAGIEGREGLAADPRILVVDGPTFMKGRADSFSNSGFEEYLKDNEINELVLVGLDGTFCVKHTALAATDRGYEVVLPKDAVITSVPAQWPKAEEEFKSAGAKISTTNNIMAA